MSEYVIDMGNSSYQSTSGLLCADVLQLREEIVRCRDCRFSLAHGNGCGRNQDIYDAEPDGFCAWGERRKS